MPGYYRLSKEDLDVLDKWWKEYRQFNNPDTADQSMREFLDSQRESMLAGKGSR